MRNRKLTEKPVDDSNVRKRQLMVQQQIVHRGIRDKNVINAMLKVKRHLFVPEKYRERAYTDQPLPIENGQTISQPYIVAFMTELLKIKQTDKILEIGTGSGYQAAILGELAEKVFTIEIIVNLGKQAEERLKALGYDNITVRVGDGYRGWPEEAPFDGIIATAAPDHIPQPLRDQLKVGGRMVIPVGHYSQELMVITRTEKGFKEKSVLPVIFVPMTGEAQSR